MSVEKPDEKMNRILRLFVLVLIVGIAAILTLPEYILGPSLDLIGGLMMGSNISRPVTHLDRQYLRVVLATIFVVELVKILYRGGILLCREKFSSLQSFVGNWVVQSFALSILILVSLVGIGRIYVWSAGGVFGMTKRELMVLNYLFSIREITIVIITSTLSVWLENILKQLR